MGSSLASGLNLTSMHPLAKSHKLDEPGSTAANYQKWTVWRKQPMRFVGMNERVVAIDGEYLHIMPGSTGRQKEEGGKATTVHFSNVVGCKQLRRHPTNFKVEIFRFAKNLDPMDPAERKKEKRRMKEEMKRVQEGGLVCGLRFFLVSCHIVVASVLDLFLCVSALNGLRNYFSGDMLTIF